MLGGGLAPAFIPKGNCIRYRCLRYPGIFNIFLWKCVWGLCFNLEGKTFCLATGHWHWYPRYVPEYRLVLGYD